MALCIMSKCGEMGGEGVRGKEEGGRWKGGEVFRARDGPTFPRMWEKCWRGSIASGGGTPTAGSE